MTKEWWEIDTSAVLRIVCKDCGVMREEITNIEATKGEKVVTIVGYCDKHAIESERYEDAT